MRKNRRNRSDSLMIGFACFIAVLILVWYILNRNTLSPTTSGQTDTTDTDLVITSLDVGKADACVIQLGDITGMIDTGTKDQYETIHTFLEDEGIDSLDFLLLTHYDRDHIGSAKKIIRTYEIGQIIAADYVSEKKYYESLMDLLQDQDNVEFPVSRTNYQFGDLSLDVMPASDAKIAAEEPEEMDNNMSLVAKLQYENESFLFTGDIEKARITDLLSDGCDLQADWIKMPHHGTCENDDSGLIQKELLESVAPHYAVISTSKKRSKDEDVATTVDLLEEMNITEYITGNGNVTTVSDGTEITVTQN